MDRFEQSALIVIDVQKAIDAPYHAVHGPRNNPEAEGRIAQLLARWRKNARPIFHVRHDSRFPDSAYRPGQEGNSFKDEVAPLAGETVIAKTTNSAFIGTPLEERLRALKVDRLVVAGVATNNSVEATVRMAGNLGFDVYLVADACFTFARPDFNGRLRSAEEVHAMSLANLSGEYCTVIDTEAVLNDAAVFSANLSKERLVDVLVQAIRSRPLSEAAVSEVAVSEVAAAVEAYKDPIAMASALNGAVREIYREFKDVTGMIAAGELGVAYCKGKAASEFDGDKARELKRAGKAIAFNTGANCWPGWGDEGVVIEAAHIRAGIAIAGKCRDLVRELDATARERGGADWLIGALQLAAGDFSAARTAFALAEQAFLADDQLLPSVLMVRGYTALARKADRQTRDQGAEELAEIQKRLRAEGSKEAVFFADQLATADRVLLEN